MKSRPNIKHTSSYTLETGEIYDLIYDYKDYEGESAKISKAIEHRKRSGGSSLLEVACGTGNYLQHFKETYEVTGFDLSEGQINAAKKKLPGTELFVADMADFDTGHQYDAVVCLFSSIAYMHTKARLDKAIANMARHTKPGGVVIVEPWLKPEKYITGYISMESNRNDKLTVARMGTSERRGNISVMQMHFMVGSSEGVEHFVETHEVAMYTDDDYADAFYKAGLEIEMDPKGLIGRGLYIGTKPPKAAESLQMT